MQGVGDAVQLLLQIEPVVVGQASVVAGAHVRLAIAQMLHVVQGVVGLAWPDATGILGGVDPPGQIVFLVVQVAHRRRGIGAAVVVPATVGVVEAVRRRSISRVRDRDISVGTRCVAAADRAACDGAADAADDRPGRMVATSGDGAAEQGAADGAQHGAAGFIVRPLLLAVGLGRRQGRRGDDGRQCGHG